MTCPLLYRFRVIDRLPEPSSPVTTRGTLVHGVLERLFDSPALERTVARAHALLEPEWQRLLAERPELETLFAAPIIEGDPSVDDQIATWLASARVLIETYFALEDPTRVEPAQRELLVEAELPDGVRLRGFVDRVDVGRGGATRIVDYKTGSSPSELFEAKALFQLKFYALVMWRMSGTIPAMLQLLYLGDKQVLRYAPDEADLLATERKVRALWAAIERALEQQNFPPRPSKIVRLVRASSALPRIRRHSPGLSTTGRCRRWRRALSSRSTRSPKPTTSRRDSRSPCSRVPAGIVA